MQNRDELYQEAVELLKQLISIPSFSREENRTANAILSFLKLKGIEANHYLNNVWAMNKYYDSAKPTILLNSHHDTVKPNSQYRNNPFEPIVKDEKLFGLGSNDAGASVVSLLSAFLNFYDKQNLKYNLVIAITAEEEISGHDGIEALLPLLSKIDFGIVGEPTQMNMAIAEKGLLVIDAVAQGKAGHAAREEGENAICKAMKDIEWINNYRFPKKSEWLGEVKMSVTVINSENKSHNIVPAQCGFVIDVRVPDTYSLEEVVETICENVKSEIKPRSMRMRSTSIDKNHPIVKAGISLNKICYGSPTTSDKALMNFPTLKCGPGDSARSHIADEYVFLSEIKSGINDYIKLLEKIIE